MEWLAGAYLAIVVFLGIGIHHVADPEDLDSAPAMFLVAVLLLLWPLTFVAMMVGRMLKGDS